MKIAFVTWALIREKRYSIIFFSIVFLILFANSLHNSYPDEFDNILGGYLITKGVLPYSGFFSHHGPMGYFLAAGITLFTGQSFVLFRLLSSVFLFTIFIGIYKIIRARTASKIVTVLPLFIGILSVTSVYFWGHMFLADPLSGYFLLPAFLLTFIKLFYQEKLTTKDLWVISLSCALSLLISLTYLYAIATISLICSYYYLGQFRKNHKHLLHKAGTLALIFLLPYFLFLLYLLITKTVSDYYFQAIIYNKNYYIYNYPRPDGSFVFNPIRYALAIFDKFFIGMFDVLVRLRYVPLDNPYSLTLGLTNVLLWGFLLFKRKFLLFLLSFLVIVFSTVRSNPAGTSATDYQGAVYVILTLLQGSLLFYLLQSEIKAITDFFQKFVLSLTLCFLGFFWFFFLLYIVVQSWNMIYARFSGTMPLIYDSPQVAPLINSVVPKNDYCWVGPFEFEELFYLNCRLPSKYHWILPQFNRIGWLKNELLADYTKNLPDVIVYHRFYSAFGSSDQYHRFFKDFIDAHYLLLEDIDPNKKYHFRFSRTKDFNLDKDFNIEKSKAQSILSVLIAKGLVEAH